MAVNATSKICLALWLLIFLLAVAWRAQNLDAFGLVNDEGAYLMWTRLAVDGYPLYTETRAVQPPLFFEWIGLAFRLAGQTVQAGRWAMLVGFALLAAALSWLAYRSRGWFAALVALVLLSLSPLIFTYSRLVMAEVPVTGLAVASLAFVFIFLDRRQKGWLFVSGLVLGLSLMIKALYPFMVAPVGLLLLWPAIRPAGSGRRWSEFILNSLIWGTGVVIPLIAVLLLYDAGAMYDQAVAFRADLRAAIPVSWPVTWTQFALFLKSHWGFWLLAFGSIILTVLPARFRNVIEPGLPRELSARIVWLVWLVVAVLTLVWHTPLFYQHLVVLAPPLILLGASFIADVVAMWQIGQNRLILKLVLALIIAAAAFNVPAMIKANQQTAAIVTGGREQEALALIKAVSGPDDFLMGDSQLLIFMAGRRTPPPLGDVALVAIKAGWQTSGRMISLNQEFQAPAVVQWSLRLPWLPEYLAWVESNYLARRVWDNDHIVYYAPRLMPEQAIPHERPIPLGDSLTWRGYYLDDATAGADQGLSLKVYWQTQRRLVEDYTVFTQLLDDRGALVAGWDSQPLGGYFPTGEWPVNEIVTDIVRLPLPDDLPPGEYTLVTGMYLLDTLERLLTPEGSDHIVMATIKVD